MKYSLIILISIIVSFQSQAKLSDESSLKILIFGDSGTGKEPQMEVARSMIRVCKKYGCDLGLS